MKPQRLGLIFLLGACILACSDNNATVEAPSEQGGSAGNAGSGTGASGAAGTAGLSGGSAGTDAGPGGSGGPGGVGGGGGEPEGGIGGAGGTAGSAGGLPHGVEGPSCAGGLVCATGGVSCCQSNLIPGGSFPMGRGTEDCGSVGCLSGSGNEGCPTNCFCTAEEQPEHNATVADFFLDTFEVTVGRFRKFMDAYSAFHPANGDGAHSMIAGSGWQSPAWDKYLPNQATLLTNIKCDVALMTWTDTAADHEHFPMNCVDWYEAFAFCIWDGGYLPTEAEWEYAAAGGDANRLYPWGSDDPSVKDIFANDYYSDNSPLVNVGTFTAGRARWGQLDLAGSMYEWALDWFDASWYGNSDGGSTCNNCANLTGSLDRVFRGGDYSQLADRLRAAFRVGHNPLTRVNSVGFRCARSH